MCDAYVIVVLAPVLGLVAYCVAQVTVARMVVGRGPYHSLRIGFACGLASVVVVACWSAFGMAATNRDRAGYVVLDVLTYLALAFGYFNFVNLTVASLRIRLLEEMRRAGGSLPRIALMDAYNSRDVAAIRLERLVQGGHLVEKDGRLHVGRLPFLIVARIFDGLHWFIIGRGRGDRA